MTEVLQPLRQTPLSMQKKLRPIGRRPVKRTPYNKFLKTMGYSSPLSHLEAIESEGRIRQRDIDILYAVHENGVMSRHQIEKLYFGAHKSTLTSDRLRELHKYYWLNSHAPSRLPEAMEDAGLPYCHVFTSGELGRIKIAVDTEVNKDDVNIYKMRSAEYLTHDLALSEMYVQVRLTELACNGDYRTGWYGTWRCKMKDVNGAVVVSPDATLEIIDNVQRKRTIWFVEIDRQAKRSTWRAKVNSYNRSMSRTPWQKMFALDGEVYPTVLAIVPQGTMRRVGEYVTSLAGNNIRFLFREWDSTLAYPVEDIETKHDKRLYRPPTDMLANWYNPRTEEFINLRG